ncbi:MAG: hypothetical protein HQK93_10360, partial [Nitrospirae bacterium]|nr:hypothetical protein [Nitrospirota bacterium]
MISIDLHLFMVLVETLALFFVITLYLIYKVRKGGGGGGGNKKDLEQYVNNEITSINEEKVKLGETLQNELKPLIDTYENRLSFLDATIQGIKEGKGDDLILFEKMYQKFNEVIDSIKTKDTEKYEAIQESKDLKMYISILEKKNKELKGKSGGGAKSEEIDEATIAEEAPVEEISLNDDGIAELDIDITSSAPGKKAFQDTAMTCHFQLLSG